MNRFGAAVGAVVGGVRAAGSMLFARASSAWNLIYSRTRIDYQSEIGDPLSNSIVAAVVGWLARNLPEAPVRILREGGSGSEARIPPGKTGAGRFLRLLEKPNPYYSGVVQWMATIADFAFGNAYWFKVRDGFGRVIEYWWIPAFMLKPKWPENDPSVFISHYEYTVDGVAYRIEPSEVIHFRNGIDPRNPRMGLSRLGSCLREIFTDNEAAAFTAALLRNLGVPGVIISPANTTQGPVRIKGAETKQAFKESFSAVNRGEPMVLSAPTEVKVLSWSPEQLNLRELRRIPEERVSAVTGVPAGVAGLGAGLDHNTFTNYSEANKAAYTQGAIPLQRLLAADLEVQALPDFVLPEADGGELESLDVWFDWTVTAAMQEALGEVWKRNESAATKGLQTRADFKRAVGRPVDPDGADDVLILPNNYLILPVGEAPPPPRPPAANPFSGTAPVELAPESTNGNGHHHEPIGAAA